MTAWPCEVLIPLPELIDTRLKSARHSAFSGAPSPSSETSSSSWSPGEPSLFRLRCGPDYLRNGFKAKPGTELYSCVAVDVVQARDQIHSVLQESRNGGSSYAPSELCGLPEILLVHFQLPFEAGPLYGPHPGDDHGCSVIITCALRPNFSADPASRLFTTYLQKHHPIRESASASGCLKVVGILENLESLEIPALLRPIVRRFNGKPVLVEKESKRYASNGTAHSENSARQQVSVLELAIDVRSFNPLARSLLARLKKAVLPKAIVQLGILIQGVSDDELPEGLLAAVRLEALDLLRARGVLLLGGDGQLAVDLPGDVIGQADLLLASFGAFAVVIACMRYADDSVTSTAAIASSLVWACCLLATSLVWRQIPGIPRKI